MGWILTADSLDEVFADQDIVNSLRASRPDLSAMSNRELVSYAESLGDIYFRDLFAQHIFITSAVSYPIAGSVTAQ